MSRVKAGVVDVRSQDQQPKATETLPHQLDFIGWQNAQIYKILETLVGNSSKGDSISNKQIEALEKKIQDVSNKQEKCCQEINSKLSQLLSRPTGSGESSKEKPLYLLKPHSPYGVQDLDKYPWQSQNFDIYGEKSKQKQLEKDSK